MLWPWPLAAIESPALIWTEERSRRRRIGPEKPGWSGMSPGELLVVRDGAVIERIG